jgi:hypothetical protein
MKKLKLIFVFVLTVCLTEHSLPQTYEGAFHEIFFGPQPSTRAEAMGRSIASIPADPDSYYYNPAGLAALNGWNINGGGTSVSKYDLLPAASFGFFGSSFKFRKLGTIGLSVETFNSGEFNLTYVNENGDTVSGKFHNYVNNCRLTLCREIANRFYAGGNLNIFIPDYDFGYLPLDKGNQGSPFLYFDLGLMKSIGFGKRDLKQELNFGASLINVNSAKYKSADEKEEGSLPVIMRIGTSYNLLLNRTFNFLFNAEYEDLLNSKYYDGIHTGFEFSLDPLLYLRAGFYTEDVPEKNIHSQLTYGAGINILFLGYFTGMERMPKFKIILDYSHLNLPSYIKESQENNKTDSYTLTLTVRF